MQLSNTTVSCVAVATAPAQPAFQASARDVVLVSVLLPLVTLAALALVCLAGLDCCAAAWQSAEPIFSACLQAAWALSTWATRPARHMERSWEAETHGEHHQVAWSPPVLLLQADGVQEEDSGVQEQDSDR